MSDLTDADREVLQRDFERDIYQREASMNSDTPKTIYLQFEDDLLDIETHRAWDEATWCVDKINDSDVEYVRADELTAARATIARLLEQLKQADARGDLAMRRAHDAEAELQALKQPNYARNMGQ